MKALRERNMKKSAIILLLMNLAACTTTSVGTSYPARIDAPQGSKVIFLTIDGTGNSQVSRTNAGRLFELVDANSADRSVPLATYYAEGVGSRGQPLGLAIGQGMGRDVREAYDFLTRTYRTGGAGRESDRITLSGFSRGAYAVRILAGLVALAGIPDLSDREEEFRAHMVADLFAAYKIGGPASLADRNLLRMKRIRAVYDRYDVTMSAQPVRIRNLVLWDTVEALGLPDRRNDPTEDVPHYFIETCNVDRVFHAMAIDDNRAFSFTPIFARTAHMIDACGGATPHVEEVWFAGAHADVGGGYAPDRQIDGFLSGVSLNWILDRLRDEGLFASNARVYEDRYGPIHDAKAYTAAYKILTRYRRTPFAYEYRSIGVDSRPYVHISVLQRLLRLKELDATFQNCVSKARVPRLLCAEELPSYGFLAEAVTPPPAPALPGAPRPIGKPCLYKSVKGYALEPGQQCLRVVCDSGVKESLSDFYCGLEESAEIRALLVRSPPEHGPGEPRTR
jgi:uncharacterized protein (DUF2235 family)